MSLGEIVLLLIVGIIVVGPRNLPPLMRTAGQWVARLRRMTTELRSQSGIDDILRNEGLDEHIHQLRSLSRINVMESLIAPAAAAGSSSSPYPPPTGKPLERAAPRADWTPGQPLREREYPAVGCDSYGALPDDVMSYRQMGAAYASEHASDDEAKAAEGEAKAAEGEGEAKAAEGDPKPAAPAEGETKVESKAETVPATGEAKAGAASAGDDSKADPGAPKPATETANS